MNINLFLNPQFLDYAPSDTEWQEKEDLENYILCYFEEEISDFPNFPRHLLNWYHAKEDSYNIDNFAEDDQRECLRNCFILAAAETIDFYGYNIDENGSVSVNLNFETVSHFTSCFLINLHEWRSEFM